MKIGHLNRKTIRRIFYTTFIFILLVQSLFFTVMYLSNLKTDYNQRVDQLAESLKEQKKNQAQLIVEEKIGEIRQDEVLLKKHYNAMAKTLSDTFTYFIEKGMLSEILYESPEWFPFNQWDYQIFDSGILLKSSLSDAEYITSQNELPVFQKSIVSKRYEINVFMRPSVFYEIYLEGVRSTIHSAKLAEDGYIWINQILDYGGGPRYALRLAHPNLPETEGSTLSTLTLDKGGNLPYLIELEGVKNSGEIFYEYYFKKLGSDIIIRKLSYAKLYDKYDWVVASGINLDDLDAFVQLEKKKLGPLYRRKIQIFLLVIFFAIMLSLILFIWLERRISSLIKRYTHEVEEEKDKLSEAFHQMKEIAYLDSLTGLLNRRAMYDKLEKEASRHKREQQQFCIILSDVDRFKTINDSYGHNTGDYVLQELAKVMKENTRLEDDISRWGGEEFLFLINAAKPQEGALIAEKLRKAIEEHIFTYDGITIPVTMTFGVCSSKENLVLKDLIEEADQKLFKGKRSTRNCVVT